MRRHRSAGPRHEPSTPPNRDLFFAAPEQQDPAACAAYLDEVCGQGTELRRRIEDLLAGEPKVSRFLESPVVTHRLNSAR